MATQATLKPRQQQSTTQKTIVGNVGADPTLRYSGKGNAWCTMRVAVTEWQRTPKGGKPGPTTWWDVTTFGTLAENVAESVSKGDRIIARGRAEMREFTRNDGTAGKTPTLLANELGVELRFATATVQRTSRTSPGMLNEEPGDMDEDF